MKRNKKIQETYKKIKELNEGAYGQVILVRSNINKQNLYVMKTISIENLKKKKKKKNNGRSKNNTKIKSSKHNKIS